MKAFTLATAAALFALSTVLLCVVWQLHEDNRSLREQMNRIEFYARHAAESSEAARKSAESAEVSSLDAIELIKQK